MTVALRPPAPQIHLPDFEGPLDLLLTLVERRRLPIAELSLALVADQYLAQVRMLAASDPEPLSEFLAIGARLLLLKSRALLPQIEPPREIDADEESPEALVRRLEVYRSFKLLAAELAERLVAGGAFTRGAAGGLLGQEAPPPLRPIAPIDLFELILAVESRGASVRVETAEPLIRTTVAQRLVYLRDRLNIVEELSWREVGGTTIDEMVATLLALLELIRRGEALADQASLFGPIRLYRAARTPALSEGGPAAVATGA